MPLGTLERRLAPHGLRPQAPVRRRPFSLVFPARQDGTGRELFVKLLTARSAGVRHNFGREIEILQALAGQPGVPALVAASIDDGQAFHACDRIHGRSLLESHRDREREGSQTFYAGVKRERELEHDVQVYRAFEREAERLEERGARIDRVVLDYELKREYQKWLHEGDRDRDDYDGHPNRDAREVEQWALEHELPYFDEQVHFPDLRIEYEELDGRRRHEDVEVLTVHYRGAHGAAAARSGFTAYRGFSARIGGRGGGGRSGGRSGGLAEEVLR